jgi:hypothetical protein
MSALPPKADICSAPAHACFGPIATRSSATRRTTNIQSSVHWSRGEAVYEDVIVDTVVPNDGMPGRIRAFEKLIRSDFLVSAADRDMPFSVLYISIINRVGIAKLATCPTNLVVLLLVPFAIRRVGVFWFPAPLDLLHDASWVASDRQHSNCQTETNEFSQRSALRLASPRPTAPESGHGQCARPCPLYPRKRTCAVHSAMSALGHKRTFIVGRSPKLRPRVPAYPLRHEYSREAW